MIRRQRQRLSSLSTIRHKQHHNYDGHRLEGCCFSMAASSSSLLQGGSDPSMIISCPSRKLHVLHHHHYSASQNLIKRFFDSAGRALLRQNRRNFNSQLSLKACSDNRDGHNYNHNDHHRPNNHIDLLNSSAFAPNLAGDSGSGLKGDPRQFATAARLANGHGGACHRGTYIQSNERIVVAVDVDEVLGNFVSALNRFIADRYSSDHSVSEYYVYEFFRIWNCSRDEADIRVHEFFKTSYFKTGIHPLPGAQLALQKLSSFCNLSVVTSRQNAIKNHTIEWIEKHYPGLFQEIHFGNHFALEGQSRPKSDICRSLGAKVLIDDNPRYAKECAEVGIRVLLFDYEKSYPWCKLQSVDQHPLVVKVHSWEEVEHQLVSLMFHQSFTHH